MNNEMPMTKREENLPEKLAQRTTVVPAVDVFESKDELLILADLPGVTRDKLEVNFAKGQLTVSGRPGELAPEEGAFDYRRTFVVPQGIDAERISAQLQNGVLRLSLPKPAALKPRTIEVKAG
jgi:HSP20 family molecular chaperone IbpA